MPEEQVDEFAIDGTPEDVLRQKELFEEAGIQYLIVVLDPSKELKRRDHQKNLISMTYNLSVCQAWQHSGVAFINIYIKSRYLIL